MPRRIAVAGTVLLSAYFLFVFGLDAFGLVSVDEPRYASIGREMAWSGDWITPRLWGEAWFEKPPLLYWMIAAATKLGLRDEWAARLPVALLSLAFLYAYWRVLGREFSLRAGWYATAMLATSAGWVAFSHAAVMDLPLAATFGGAMLAAMPWVARGERRGLTLAGALLGAAVLAKALVPLALVVPALWFGRRRWRDLGRPLAAFAVVALPWYLACWWVNGRVVFDELIWRHHFERLVSESLQHVRPWWFYGPVLLGGLFPWTPLLGLVFWRRVREDPRLGLFAGWALIGFVLFSAGVNKLPGYLLPLLPAVFALIGVRLADSATKARWLPVCGLVLGLIPVVGTILPKAMADGLSSVQLTDAPWAYVGIGFVSLFALRRVGRERALAVLATVAVLGVVYLKVVTLPVLDRLDSARGAWRTIVDKRDVCIEDVNRKWRYGLNYYSVTPLPNCANGHSGPRLRQVSGGLVVEPE